MYLSPIVGPVSTISFHRSDCCLFEFMGLLCPSGLMCENEVLISELLELRPFVFDALHDLHD